MPASLTGGAAPFGITENKEFFIRKMLIRATPKLMFNQFANKDYIPSRSGLSVEWRRFSTIAASTTALTEGTAGSETIPTVVIITRHRSAVRAVFQVHGHRAVPGHRRHSRRRL